MIALMFHLVRAVIAEGIPAVSTLGSKSESFEHKWSATLSEADFASGFVAGRPAKTQSLDDVRAAIEPRGGKMKLPEAAKG
jgi:hypothetical protein